MARIIQLEKHVAELIAAGEVVERPASVVKELVENSIDAGAKSITIEIRRGGNSLIRISDNGHGISKEDVPTSFLRHATSKVRDENDLVNIGTLGFRGEALASICAVSKVRMETRTDEEMVGTKIIVEGGEVRDICESGHNVGTTITIRDIFYNTPARMKFLKSDITEANAVAAYIDRLALSHVEISFKFIRDGKVTLYTPGDNQLISSVYTIFGKDFAKSLIPIEYSDAGVTVRGLISKPESSRGSRSMQYFFVNNRFVKTNTAQVAMEEAYKNEIMQRKFPACILFIYVKNDMVDVNTHPAKIEVRFVDERAVYNSVYFAVKNVLSKFSPPPSIDLGLESQKALIKNEGIKNETAGQIRIDAKDYLNSLSKTSKEEPYSINTSKRDREGTQKHTPKDSENSSYKNLSLKDAIKRISQKSDSGAITFRQDSIPYTSYTKESKPQKLSDKTLYTSSEIRNEPISNPRIENDIIEKDIFSHMNFIGEIFETYIIAQHDDTMILIDKHAAHERIIFERLKSTNMACESQLLIEPITVTLDKNEYSLILEKKSELSKMGIMIDDFGMGMILVREFPIGMEYADIVAVIEEIGSNLKKGKRDVSPVFLDELYHSIACKAAIKGNTRSSDKELQGLIEMLWQNGEIRHCPHGRPVAVVLEKKEIEKRFGRIV